MVLAVVVIMAMSLFVCGIISKSTFMLVVLMYMGSALLCAINLDRALRRLDEQDQHEQQEQAARGER